MQNCNRLVFTRFSNSTTHSQYVSYIKFLNYLFTSNCNLAINIHSPFNNSTDHHRANITVILSPFCLSTESSYSIELVIKRRKTLIRSISIETIMGRESILYMTCLHAFLTIQTVLKITIHLWLRSLQITSVNNILSGKSRIYSPYPIICVAKISNQHCHNSWDRHQNSISMHFSPYQLLEQFVQSEREIF